MGTSLVTISVGITYIAWHVHCITCQHMRTGGICIPARIGGDTGMVVGARAMCCRSTKVEQEQRVSVTDVTRHRQVADATGPRLVTISVGITYIAWHVHCITCQHMRTGGICIPTRRVPRRSPVPTVWVGGCACAWFWSCASAARLRARVRRSEGGALACAWRAASGGCLARVPPALPDLAVRLCLRTSAWRHCPLCVCAVTGSVVGCQ